jgi:hypothetical protein
MIILLFKKWMGSEVIDTKIFGLWYELNFGYAQLGETRNLLCAY